MRRRVQSAETISGGWRETGVGNVYVDSATHWERMWGAGAKERCHNKKWLLMGGVRRRRETRNIQKLLRQVGWEGLE